MKKILTILLTILGLALTGTAQVVPIYVPTSGLLGWYPFNNNVNDESGNGNNATNFGATETTDRFGASDHAYQFNGFSNYINLNSDYDYAQRTINIWVNASVIDNLSRHIYVSDNPALSHGFTQMRAENSANGSTMTMITNACNGTYFGAHTTSANVWVMLTIAVGADSVRHYYNGILYHVSPLGTITSNIGESTALLATSRILDRFFLGKLDDLGIWNRALTAAEITNLFNGPNGISSTTFPKNSLSISPNPTQSNITVSLKNLPKSIKYQLVIKNMTGQQLLKTAFAAPQQSLDLTEIASGIYFLSLTNEAGEVIANQKLVLE